MFVFRNETRSLFLSQKAKRSIFLDNKFEFEKRDKRLLMFKFSTKGVKLYVKIRSLMKGPYLEGR